MRRIRAFVVKRAGTIQGVASAVCVAAGAFILWGVGWALIAVGAFLLVGAWGSQ